MNLRTLPVSMAAALCFLAASSTVSPALLAAPLGNSSTPNPMHPAKVHRVSFQLRNASTDTIALGAGTDNYTVKPGETISLKLPEGQALTAMNSTPHYATGSVVASVSRSLDGNTVVLN